MFSTIVLIDMSPVKISLSLMIAELDIYYLVKMSLSDTPVHKKKIVINTSV